MDVYNTLRGHFNLETFVTCLQDEECCDSERWLLLYIDIRYIYIIYIYIVATCICIMYNTVFSLKIRHSKYSSPAKNLSKCILIADEFPVSNIRHIALIIRQTERAFQYFVTKRPLAAPQSSSSLLVVFL